MKQGQLKSLLHRWKRKRKRDAKKQKERLLIFEVFNFKDNKVKSEMANFGKNFNIFNLIRNLALIFIGSLLNAFSYYYFINKAGLYTNGLSAFAQLISKFIVSSNDSALYFYLILFAMNIPFIIWGSLKVGVRFAFYTTLYMIFNIAITFIIQAIPWLSNFTIFAEVTAQNESKLTKPFIFAILGGLIYGAGLGLLFKAGGSSGGVDFISTYISIKRRYSIANSIKNTNIIIVITAVLIDGIFIKKNSNIANIYFAKPQFFATIVYIYIASFIMNRVYPKYMMMTIFIISNEINKIRENIYGSNYVRGGNIWKITGLYSGNNYNMMMTTMSLLEYNFFKNKILMLDPNLYMIAVPTKYMHGGNGGKFPNKAPVDVKIIEDFLNSSN